MLEKRKKIEQIAMLASPLMNFKLEMLLFAFLALKIG